MDIPRSLRDLYRFPGFEPQDRITVSDDEPGGVVITLHRRPQKDTAGSADNSPDSTTTPDGDRSATCRAEIDPSPCTFPSFASSAIVAAA